MPGLWSRKPYLRSPEAPLATLVYFGLTKYSNPMRGTTFSVWLASLGMFLSHSRQLVKNDNPYIESFFKTMKYHAAYPGRFHSLEEVHQWMGDFIHWYNTVHRHSGIGFVTPAQRMRGEDLKLFALAIQRS